MNNLVKKQGNASEGFSLAIDASRNRSGGAIAHIKGILICSNPSKYNINIIHLWSYKELLDDIPDFPWLKKHSHPFIEKSIFYQIFWQKYIFKNAFDNLKCDILLNLDAGTFSKIKPCVTMSRDMLSYEKGISSRYGISIERLRIFLLKYIQNISLSEANGVIFLTKYAADVIQNYCGQIKTYSIISHGLSDNFKIKKIIDNWPKSSLKVIECVYVSNIDFYKNQITVLKAFKKLIEYGFNIKITFVGNFNKRAKVHFLKEKSKIDPHDKFSKVLGFIKHKNLHKILQKSHLFIFASSCENMPNTLVEGMASGLPIACSSAGPMPEVLKDGGLYFDPNKIETLVKSISEIIQNNKLRSKIANRSFTLSQKYTWEICGNKTWSFLKKIHKNASC